MNQKPNSPKLILQNYELYVIFSPQTEATKAEEAITNFLNKTECQNINTNREGLRHLAYPIKKHQSGLYYLVSFDIALEKIRVLNSLLAPFNVNSNIIRYLLVNQTDFLKQKSKEKLNNNPEFINHRDLNKGKVSNKKCLSKYLGLRAIDYKDIDYINQFTSPYSKIFDSERTGNSAKYQRKISQAIKRARHMALLSFTPKYQN